MQLLVARSYCAAYKGRMKHFTRTCLALVPTVLLSTAAFAGTTTPTHVVELFTSQGCSSCPPANKFAGKLAETHPDMLVLSYGVTYWDYLGWEDTFGDPEFTERQKAYRDGMMAKNIYTPQFVLNGAQHKPRYKTGHVESAALQSRANLSLDHNGSVFVVTGDAPSSAKLVLVTYRPGKQDVSVKRGENGGKTLTLSNVVLDVAPLSWNGISSQLAGQPKDGLAYAVLLHDPKTAAVLAASVYTP